MQATRRNIQLELALEPAAKGEARSAGARGTEARMARAEPERPAAGQEPSMEAVVEPGNLKKALARVRRNKGAPGVDGMTVDELGDHLKAHWPEIRSRLLAGSYTPQPVRRVEIPKASGGVRLLGVPTVLDRFIQQAVMQVLQEEWDPGFSDASYGFRPGRSAHQAVRRAQEHILAGFDIVVDLDLEKFFDRVNHDILMGLVAKRVADKRLLRLIRGFLTAGVLDGGLVGPTTKGTRPFLISSKVGTTRDDAIPRWAMCRRWSSNVFMRQTLWTLTGRWRFSRRPRFSWSPDRRRRLASSPAFFWKHTEGMMTCRHTARLRLRKARSCCESSRPDAKTNAGLLGRRASLGTGGCRRRHRGIEPCTVSPRGAVEVPGLGTPGQRRAESGGRRGGRPQSVGNLAGDRCRPCLRRGREIPTLPQRSSSMTDTENDVHQGRVMM